jgi:hypothetical protein
MARRPTHCAALLSCAVASTPNWASPSHAVERLQLAILRSRCPPWPEKAHVSCQESDDKPLDASKRTERYDTSRSSGFWRAAGVDNTSPQVR